jgi:hypothetical protein
LLGVRWTSGWIGYTLKTSYAEWRVGSRQQLNKILTNLSHSEQVWHGVEVVRCEINFISGSDSSQHLRDLCSESCLDMTFIRELPEDKCQLRDRFRLVESRNVGEADRFCCGFVARQHDRPASRLKGGNYLSQMLLLPKLSDNFVISQPHIWSQGRIRLD